MIRIELVTRIAAPIERCFDLARSIDLHMASTDWTGEQAIAGITSGLIGPEQEVTWKGRHFGLVISHTSRITGYDRPTYFQDCMVRGAFRSFCHDHFFEGSDATTLMTDALRFAAPLGVLGSLAERLVLKRHVLGLLLRRNQHIRRVAESGEWRRYLT
jgi:ligand-binding SRPBCC domain-containing protein